MTDGLFLQTSVLLEFREYGVIIFISVSLSPFFFLFLMVESWGVGGLLAEEGRAELGG